MSHQHPYSRIQLSPDGERGLIHDLHALYIDEFDQELSDFRAQRLVDFFTRRLGAPIYNQAVQDARKFMLEKLDDIEGDLYEIETENETSS